MPNVSFNAIAGLTFYAKPSTDGVVDVSNPWGSDDIAINGAGSVYTFTAVSGQEYLVFQQLGGSPANTDDNVGTVYEVTPTTENPGASIIPGVCTVRFVVVDTSGAPVENASVLVWLEETNPTVDTALVSRTKTKGKTNAQGYVDIPMIQYAQFELGGTYVVQVLDSAGRILHYRRVRVPTLASCFADELIAV